MTVYVVHAPGDIAVAEKVARAFERDGTFVETEDGGRPFAALMGRDLVCVLWTEATAAAPDLLTRALDAWAVDRLLVAAIDGAALPPILADLPRLDVTSGAAPSALFEAARGRLEALAPLDPKAPATAPEPSSAKPAADRLGVARRLAMGSALMFAGAGLAAAGWAGLGAPGLDLAAPLAAPPALLPPIAMALVGVGLVLALAAAAFTAAAPRPAAAPPARAVILVGDAARCAALAPALAAESVAAAPGADMRAALAEADGVVVVASGAAGSDGPVLRAAHLARRAGKPVVVLRDTPAGAGPMIDGAPNAAWPGNPRAAAAMALSLIDAARSPA